VMFAVCVVRSVVFYVCAGVVLVCVGGNVV